MPRFLTVFSSPSASWSRTNIRPRLVVGRQGLDRIAEPPVEHAEVDQQQRALTRPKVRAGAQVLVERQRFLVAPEPLVERSLVGHQQTAAARRPWLGGTRRRERESFVVETARVGIGADVEVDVGKVAKLLGASLEKPGTRRPIDRRAEEPLCLVVVAGGERREALPVHRQRRLGSVAERIEELRGGGGMPPGIGVVPLTGFDRRHPEQGAGTVERLRLRRVQGPVIGLQRGCGFSVTLEFSGLGERAAGVARLCGERASNDGQAHERQNQQCAHGRNRTTQLRTK